MFGYLLVRIENHSMPSDVRRRRVLQALDRHNDAQLLSLASRRDRQEPKRDLRPVIIALPPAALARIDSLPDRWNISVSALIDRLLDQSGEPKTVKE